MKRKRVIHKTLNITVVSLLLVFVVSTATALDATVENLNPDIVAGSTTNTTLTFASDKQATVEVAAIVQPDDVGFNITFSERTFTFTGTHTIIATIHLVPYVAPQEYTITFTYSYTLKSSNEHSSGHTTPITTTPVTDTDEDDSPTDENDTTPSNGNDTVPDDQPDNNTTDNTSPAADDDNREYPPLLLLFSVAILILIILFLLIVYRLRKANAPKTQ